MKKNNFPGLSAICLLFTFMCLKSFSQDNLSEEWEKGYLQRQPPEKIMPVIGVKQGMVIGEIGAGRGRFTVYLAKEVGLSGKVYANDIDGMALSYLKGRAVRQGFNNIEVITGRPDDPRFMDNSLDMAIMVLVYHMIEKPDDLLRNIKSGLKPGANLVIIDPVDKLIDQEFGIDRSLPGEKPPTIRERIERSAREAGYELIKTETFLPDDYIFILKPADKKLLASERIRETIYKSGIAEAQKQFEIIKKDTLQYNLDPEHFLNLGYEFYGRRTLSEGIAALNMAISLNPKLPELYNSIGEFYLVHGDKEKARNSFIKAKELKPEDPTAAYVLDNIDQIYNDMHPVTKK